MGNRPPLGPYCREGGQARKEKAAAAMAMCTSSGWSTTPDTSHPSSAALRTGAGSYLRLIDFVYHSNLGLRVTKKKKKKKTEHHPGHLPPLLRRAAHIEGPHSKL